MRVPQNSKEATQISLEPPRTSLEPLGTPSGTPKSPRTTLRTPLEPRESITRAPKDITVPLQETLQSAQPRHGDRHRLGTPPGHTPSPCHPRLSSHAEHPSSTRRAPRTSEGSTRRGARGREGGKMGGYLLLCVGDEHRLGGCDLEVLQVLQGDRRLGLAAELHKRNAGPRLHHANLCAGREEGYRG